MCSLRRLPRTKYTPRRIALLSCSCKKNCHCCLHSKIIISQSYILWRRTRGHRLKTTVTELKLKLIDLDKINVWQGSDSLRCILDGIEISSLGLYCLALQRLLRGYKQMVVRGRHQLNEIQDSTYPFHPWLPSCEPRSRPFGGWPRRGTSRRARVAGRRGCSWKWCGRSPVDVHGRK